MKLAFTHRSAGQSQILISSDAPPTTNLPVCLHQLLLRIPLSRAVGGTLRWCLMTSSARKELIDFMPFGSCVSPDRTCITPLPVSVSLRSSDRPHKEEPRTDLGEDDVGGMEFVDESGRGDSLLWCKVQADRARFAVQSPIPEPALSADLP